MGEWHGGTIGHRPGSSRGVIGLIRSRRSSKGVWFIMSGALVDTMSTNAYFTKVPVLET